MSNVTKTIKIFSSYSWKYKKDVLLGTTVMLQVALNVILAPLLIGFGIAKISKPDSVRFSFITIILLLLISSVIALLINRISTKAIDKFELAANKDLFNKIAEHLLNESYEFHSKSFSGALVSQATKLSQAYVSFIDTVFLTGLRWIVVVFASSITLYFYDVRLASIMLTTALAGIFATTYMVRKRYPLQKSATIKASNQNAYLADMITNAITIKTFSTEKYEQKQYDRLLGETATAYRKAWLKQVDANNVTLAMVSVMNIAILTYGIYAIQHGIIQTGVFIAAQLYAVRLSGAFWDASSMIRAFERVFADSHEMIENLEQTPALLDKPGAKQLELDSGELDFKNVTFHYSDVSSKNNVLKNFNLKIKSGEKIGLVGRSGGGKTTITKLVLRFMDIQEGSILIDNQNIAEVTQNSLRNSISYVPQEPLLFHRTIKENIGYGKTDATLDDIIIAAKLSQAHDFITKLPNGYDTEVGERGVKLSGGQRQRVAIARAMLKDSPILVLDEATSALDSESEVMIQKALWKLMEGRTALVIAHRLSTVQKMDRIIVVDDGKIIEEGTHKQLLDNNGVYSGLWKHQSGGFLEEN